ncbi:MAG: hypothetical protein ABW001_02500 [Mycobacterium sp.]
MSFTLAFQNEGSVQTRRDGPGCELIDESAEAWLVFGVLVAVEPGVEICDEWSWWREPFPRCCSHDVVDRVIQVVGAELDFDDLSIAGAEAGRSHA